MSSSEKPPAADPNDGLFQTRYPEASVSAIVFGLIFGAIMNVAMTYSGLKMGFTNPGSAIAAVVGFGVLRGVLRRGSILEVAIGQTMTTGMTLVSSGVIFTVPVLYLLGERFGFTDSRYWLLTLASITGAVLGVVFIVPLRKQMLEIERLRFPTPTAVAAILKSPGAGKAKSLVLVAGVAVGALLYAPSGLPALGLPGYASLNLRVRAGTTESGARAPGAGSLSAARTELVVTNDSLDLGRLLGLSDLLPLAFAIAPFAFGVGCLVGRPGLLMLAGGVMAHLVLNPLVYKFGWTPATISADRLQAYALDVFDRPIGIGVLLGGALAGLFRTAPSMYAGIVAVFRTPRKGVGASRDEMDFRLLGGLALGGIAVLLAIAEFTDRSGHGDGWFHALNPTLARVLIVLFSAVWTWFAGVIIAQCAGMADASPISGIALLTVVAVLMLAGKGEVLLAVTMGTALCSAMICASDMMGDLKTGYLVGAQPRRQQVLQLLTSAIGPVISMAALTLIVGANLKLTGKPIGPGTSADAPQAQALQAIIIGVQHGNVPYALYGFGAVLGALLGLSLPGSLGVLAGLSMYLKFNYILTYGAGCLANLGLARMKGRAWVEAWAMPFGAGLIVGEALLALLINLLVMFHR